MILTFQYPNYKHPKVEKVNARTSLISFNFCDYCNMEITPKVLNNGLRICYIPQSFNNICHVALTIGVGTRHEKTEHNGMAHYIEHTIFKGTKKRKPFHILSRIDSVGGELNAFTTKEETCIYISVHNNYLERAVELLSDLFFSATFPEKEIIKEKEVIKDEIQMYLDTPSEQIYDDFEEFIFKKHPLGLSILGSHKSLDNIKRKDVLNFIKEHYVPSNAVLSASTPSGEIHFNKIAQKYFSKNVNKTDNTKNNYRINKTTINKSISRNVVQAHSVIGNFAYARNNPRRTSLVLLNNLLGGPGMNSRLNLNIREKYGFTYQIDSSYQTYTETGIFSIYFSTDFSKKERTEELIYKELNLLCKKKLSSNQLNAAKRQFIGQLTLSRENVLNMVLGAGKSVLYKGYVESFNDVIKRIDKISSTEIIETANQIFEPKKLSVLNYVKL